MRAEIARRLSRRQATLGHARRLPHESVWEPAPPSLVRAASPWNSLELPRISMNFLICTTLLLRGNWGPKRSWEVLGSQIQIKSNQTQIKSKANQNLNQDLGNPRQSCRKSRKSKEIQGKSYNNRNPRKSKEILEPRSARRGPGRPPGGGSGDHGGRCTGCRPPTGGGPCGRGPCGRGAPGGSVPRNYEVLGTTKEVLGFYEGSPRIPGSKIKLSRISARILY